MKHRVWPILLASGLGLAVLLTLGVWQLQRLQWKQALIASIDQRTQALPKPLADVLMAVGRGEDMSYQRVSFSGKCIKGAYLRFLVSHDGLPAYRIIQACEFLNSGSALMVDLGAVPEHAPNLWLKQAETLTLPDEPDRFYAEIEGIVLTPSSRRGTFDPENNADKNLWHWWDNSAVQLALTSKLPAGVDLTNLLVQQTVASATPNWPKPVPVKANLRNNHLGYAITWFGLAVVLIVMTTLFVRSRMKSA
jgi:surfeit locus 1 family protein